MFDEHEPGKPQNWGWTIGIIALICIFNLVVFVTIRVILDSENEFDEPLVQGELRQALTKFIGLFALSFCFGCWCCFCCMGNCFKWATCCFHPRTRENCTGCWASFVHHQQNIAEQVQKKSSMIFVVNRRADRVATEEGDLEMGQKEDSQKSRKAYVRFNLNEEQPHDIDQEQSPRPRPKNLNNDLVTHAQRKINHWTEIQQWGRDPLRRHSIAFGANSGQSSHTIGVQDIHYYEVPVSLMTPSAVAILDPGFAERSVDCSTDSDELTSVATTNLSPTMSPTSPGETVSSKRAFEEEKQ